MASDLPNTDLPKPRKPDEQFTDPFEEQSLESQISLLKERERTMEKKQLQLEAQLCSLEQSNQQLAATIHMHDQRFSAIDERFAKLEDTAVQPKQEEKMEYVGAQEIDNRLSLIEQRLSKVEGPRVSIESPLSIESVEGATSRERLPARDNSGSERSEHSKKAPRAFSSGLETQASTYLTHSLVDVELEHTWVDSLWDISVFIGTPVLSPSASISVTLCLVLNFVLLLAFISQCKDALIVSEFDEQSQHDFDLWRSNVAHDVRFRDFTGESLASGICREKLFLPLGNRQLTMVLLLRSYLEEQQFLGMEFSSGSMLCSLSLCVWLLALTVEIRSILDVISAFWHVPFEERTRFLRDSADESRMRIVSTSACRRLFVGVISALRLITVTVLGWYGILFLVHEVEITDMILNCVALYILLDLDELLFAALVPKIPQVTLGRIMPVKYGHRRKDWNTWGVFLVLTLIILTTLVVIIHTTLNPFVQGLRDNLHALCGGDPSTYDFVVAVDAIGIPWAATTSSSSSVPETYSQSAIAKVKNEDCPLPVSPLWHKQRNNTGCFMQVFSADLLERFTVTLQEFLNPIDWEIVSHKVSLEAVGWSEEAVALGDKDLADEPGTVYNYYLQHMLGVSGDVSCAQIPFERCTSQGSSEHAVVMRQLCPNRCGCASPTTGTVGTPYGRNIKVGFRGCAPFNFRSQQFVDALKNQTCVDTMNEDEFASWAMGVGSAPSTTGGMLKDDLLYYFNNGGCPWVASIDLGDGEFSRMCSETSLPAVCPQSCGCDPNVAPNPLHSVRDDFCPFSCNKTQPPCITVESNYAMYAGSSIRSGYACVFPFIYKSATYYNCTSKDWPRPWCAVVVDEQGASHLWGECPDGC